MRWTKEYRKDKFSCSSVLIITRCILFVFVLLSSCAMREISFTSFRVDYSSTRRSSDRLRRSYFAKMYATCRNISLSFPKVLVEAKLSACLTNVRYRAAIQISMAESITLGSPKPTVGVNGLILMTRSGNANAYGNTILKESISYVGKR